MKACNENCTKFNTQINDQTMNRIITLITSFCISITAFSLTVEEKTKIVENVYKRVYAAMGQAQERPRFVFDTKQASKIAYMMKDRDGNPIIGFEEKAFDVCEKFGAKRDEAIAYLLGHEISHHHYGHHWGNEFSSAYSVNNLIAELKTIDKEGIKKFETQADERGGIYCYLAGYDVQGISEKLLRDLYQAYEITNSPKYPSLEERIQIAKERDSIVSTYIKVFETANYAMLLNEYEIAIDGYEYVIGKGFHSREIYNNLGVVYFLKGVELAEELDVKYIYPIEIDMESRISDRGSSKGFGAGDEFFLKALEKFEQATKFDKSYSTAYLNAACVHSIFKDFDEAEFFINKAIKMAEIENRSNVIDNAMLVKAIIYHQQQDGDKEEMKKIMNGLIKKGNSYAKYNQLIFDGKSADEITFSGVPVSWSEDISSTNVAPTTVSKETMDNIRSYEGDLDVDLFEEIKFTRFESIECGTRPESVIYKVSNKTGDVYVFHAAKSGYKGTSTKGMKIGSTKNQLLETYGNPSVVMNSRQGSILLYPKHKLIFVLDESDCISTWILVRIL